MASVDPLDYNPATYQAYVSASLDRRLPTDGHPGMVPSSATVADPSWYQGRATRFRDLARRSPDAALAIHLNHLADQFDRAGPDDDGPAAASEGPPQSGHAAPAA